MQDTRQLFLMITVLLLALTRGATADDTVAALSRSSRLPAYLLELPGSVSDILIADVASATMRRFVRSGGNIVEKDQRYMSIGLNGTGKERAWDRKTPLGVYFITEKLDTSKLNDKYGLRHSRLIIRMPGTGKSTEQVVASGCTALIIKTRIVRRGTPTVAWCCRTRKSYCLQK